MSLPKSLLKEGLKAASGLRYVFEKWKGAGAPFFVVVLENKLFLLSMKEFILLLLFFQSISIGLFCQNYTTSYVTEYELVHWADRKYDLLSTKVKELIYSSKFDLYDSSGIKLDTSQVRKILYYEYIAKASKQKNNYEPILKIDSVSGNISLHYKQLRATDPDSIYDKLVVVRNIEYIPSFIFKGNYVGISYRRKLDTDDFVFMLKKDFESLLDDDLELFIRYFNKKSILNSDSIHLESNRILRNINYNLANLTISGDVKVYRDNNLENPIDKKIIPKLGLHQRLVPKDTLENGIVNYDTIYTSVIEHLPGDFSQLYFVFDRNFKLTAISSFYYMTFGGVAIGKGDLGFVKKKDAFTILEEDKHLILTLIDYATKLKLSESYDNKIRYIKEKSK